MAGRAHITRRIVETDTDPGERKRQVIRPVNRRPFAHPRSENGDIRPRRDPRIRLNTRRVDDAARADRGRVARAAWEADREIPHRGRERLVADLRPQYDERKRDP